GTGVAPKYSDYQGKLVYDLSPSHQLSLLGVAGIDFIEFDKEQSIEDGNVFYGKWDGYEYSVGFNWRALWGRRGYSNTSLAILGTRFRGAFRQTDSDKQLSDENTLEKSWQLRNVNVCQLGEFNHLEFGLDAKQLVNDYDLYLTSSYNSLGIVMPPLDLEQKVRSLKVGVFALYSWRPLKKLTTTVGLRYDYFEYNDHSHISPRFSFTYRLSDGNNLNGATGIYYQNLPLGLLAQQKSNRNLNDPVAYHYVLGVTRRLGPSAKLTVDVYYKVYDNFPLDSIQPQLFIADAWVYRGFYQYSESLAGTGRARSYGIELTLQKKLVEGFYGLLSAAWFRSRYEGLDNVWRDRVIDNRVIFGIEGGYKPNNRWEYSLRWIFAGGPGYTPLDLDMSREINRSVLDHTRVNAERRPDYHSMNLRVDRRFHFRRTSLILFFSVWNVYNRKNIYRTYWNTVDREQGTIYQWSILPVMGLEFEF
ncbi:MAG: TonB-dependent receptor, partial [candidate division Zixibacteria bacterium]|nr:TonB-dependent receptor [candidate division Zixibacteria bacterium]